MKKNCTQIKYRYKEGIITEIDSEEYNKLEQESSEYINTHSADKAIAMLDADIQLIIERIDELAIVNNTEFEYAEDAAPFDPELISEYKHILKLKNVVSLLLIRTYISSSLKPLSQDDLQNMEKQIIDVAKDLHKKL